MGVGSIASGLWSKTAAMTAKASAGVAGGLRISGRLPEEAAAIAQAEKAEREKAANPNKKESTFAEMLSSRFDGAKGGNLKLSDKLASSLESVARKIDSEFGQEAGLDFRAIVLEATEGRVTESNLANSVGYFARDLALSQEGGYDFKKKMASFHAFLNGDESESGSLTEVLNGFFGRKEDAKSSSGALKHFSSSLDWVFKPKKQEAEAAESEEAESESYAPPEKAASAEPQADGYYIGSPDSAKAREGYMSVSAEAIQGVVKHIREAIGSESAAKYLEDNASAAPSKAIATAVAIVLKEEGKEAAADLVERLDLEVAPAATCGEGQVVGWNLGTDYSLPESDSSYYEGAGAPEKGSFGESWLGDAEALLEKKGHQGLLLNYSFPDSGSQTVAVSYDLDELYSGWSITAQGVKGVDVYV